MCIYAGTAEESGGFLVKVSHVPKLAFREDVDTLISSFIQGPYRIQSVHHIYRPSPSWFVQLDSKIDQQTLLQTDRAFFAGRMIRFRPSTENELREEQGRGKM